MSESKLIDFVISQDKLQASLQMLAGVVDRKQNVEIVSHFLFRLQADGCLEILATDMEVELKTFIAVDVVNTAGSITLPGRKLLDICRSLPSDAMVSVVADQKQAVIKSARSRFALAVLNAEDFPSLELDNNDLEFSVTQDKLRFLLEHTHFAMAQQDVRTYYNGLLLALSGADMKMIASNGHRLSLCEVEVTELNVSPTQIILPRKCVAELLHLLEASSEAIELALSENHISFKTDRYIFTSKLVEGQFPDYTRVIPERGSKQLLIAKSDLKQALQRVAILTNEKFKGMRFELREEILKISTNNPEQEKAEEELPIDYKGGELDIGFNVSYFLDVINILPDGEVRLSFGDNNSSVLIESPKVSGALFLIMPMRL